MAHVLAPPYSEICLPITYEYATIVTLFRLWIANLSAQIELYTVAMPRNLGDPALLPADRAELEKLLRPGEALEQLEDGTYHATLRIASSRELRHVVQALRLCVELITKALDNLEERAALVATPEPCMCAACMPERPGPRMLRPGDKRVSTALGHVEPHPERLTIYASEVQALVQLLATAGVNPIVALPNL